MTVKGRGVVVQAVTPEGIWSLGKHSVVGVHYILSNVSSQASKTTEMFVLPRSMINV